MHLYIITRGIKNHVDQFITELQGKYLPMKYDNGNKILVDYNLQTAVRPIQLWEIVFPEEYKDLMLATILPDGKGGQTQHKWHKKFIWSLRKILNIEKIPEYNLNNKIPISMNHMEMVGIGIKKDYWIDVRDGKKYDKKENEFCFEGI